MAGNQASLLGSSENEGGLEATGNSICCGIYRLPPEIWEQILENLMDPKDCINASSACTYFEDNLCTSKPSWLFTVAFPLVLHHLSKLDVLHCRLVSKRWAYAVDQLLLKNCYHRPASSNLFLSNRVRPFATLLFSKKLLYNDLTTSERITKVLNSHESFPHCKLLGQSACLKISMLPQDHHPENIKFVEKLGRQILFLKISVHNLEPVHILRRTVELLVHLPNLKKLDIYGGICPRFLRNMLLREQVCRQQVSDFMESLCSDLDLREKLPKVETLDCELTGICHSQIKETLLRVFCTRSLESLAMNLPQLPPHLGVRNLKDLSISLETDFQLNSLLQLRAPLQRLILYPCGSVNAQNVFKAPCHFSKTLQNLGVNFSLQFYASSGCSKSVQDNLFGNPDIWKGLKNLKRMSFRGCITPSFNFLCGIGSHLEYLHIFMENVPEGLPQANDNAGTNQDNKREVLNLSNCLQSLSSDRMAMYKCNAWKLFPRLKELTVLVCTEIGESQGNETIYRRDVFEKLTEIQNTLHY